MGKLNLHAIPPCSRQPNSPALLSVTAVSSLQASGELSSAQPPLRHLSRHFHQPSCGKGGHWTLGFLNLDIDNVILFMYVHTQY